MSVVQFDIDGVLADFIRGYTRLGKKYGLTETGDNDNARYGTVHLHGDVELEDQLWREIKASPTFWMLLPEHVTRTTFQRINALQDQHDVVFATNRPGLHAKWQTQQWLKNQGVEYPTVVVTAKKGEFARAAGVTHCIEDKAGNAVYIAYENPGIVSCLVDRPYNRFPADVLGSKVRRVASVDEFLDLVEKEGR